MTRIALVTRLKPEAVDRYVALHAEPPAEVLAVLEAMKISNYTICLDRSTASLFAVLDYGGGDFEADARRFGASPAMMEWEAIVGDCRAPGEEWRPLEIVFQLKVSDRP